MPAKAQIGVITSDVEMAADAIISAAMHGLNLVGRVREGEDAALNDLEALFCTILEACAFQDIVGQRLQRLLAGGLAPPGADPLLNGPSNPGLGLDQTAADTVFSAPERGV